MGVVSCLIEYSIPIFIVVTQHFFDYSCSRTEVNEGGPYAPTSLAQKRQSGVFKQLFFKLFFRMNHYDLLKQELLKLVVKFLPSPPLSRRLLSDQDVSGHPEYFLDIQETTFSIFFKSIQYTVANEQGYVNTEFLLRPYTHSRLHSYISE